ncbi:MAG: hypothetical protein KDI42_08850 [Gammaproteobacteria bacterium]|nr:hypothetical protein [Gammaproteobacteria bacterium]MCP5140836.1 hypothetical protein [Gammaproteobacteria bacterium]MCP5352956.1 hypothetical protein [Chromatiales bacterium]
MLEPVATENFLIAFAAGAMVLLAGAGYAGGFAFARLYGRPLWMRLAWLSYALLAISVAVLTEVMNFSGYWLALSVAMLLGYLLAPHAIWHLTHATHGAEPHSHTSPEENTR